MEYFFSLDIKTRIALIVGALLLLYILYCAVSFFVYLSVSRKLVAQAKSYQIDRRGSMTSTTSLLILGDSTGVGVGAATPEESVGGLLASKMEAATVENYAVSGAVVADLSKQISQAKLKEYSFILIQIGANDVVRFQSVEKVAQNLDSILSTLPKAHRVAVMMAGNVGDATLFPWFMRPIYTSRTLAFHKAFTEVVKLHKFTYANLYKQPAEDLFYLRPDIYLAKDGFHPSSRGYSLWFDDLLNSL